MTETRMGLSQGPTNPAFPKVDGVQGEFVYNFFEKPILLKRPRI